MMLKWLWISVVVIVLDQASKWAIRETFFEGELLEITTFFNLTLAYNTGAAFSILQDAGGWQRWFFIGLALALTLVLLVWLTQLRGDERLAAMAISLVIGGGIGNLIDRVLLPDGRVTDFIQLHIGHCNYCYWPSFNVADSAISVGVVLLLLSGLWTGQDRHNNLD